MRRRRIHGHRRRKSSCRPSPFKSNHEAVADPKKAATEDTKFEEAPSWFERNYGEEASDAKQDVLTLAGASPGVVGMGADAANTIISGGITILNAVTGNWSKAGKHLINTGLNVASFFPGTESIAIGRLSQSEALANTGARIRDNILE